MVKFQYELMSEINVRLKHNFEDSDKLFRILFAAIKIGKPASKRKIADVADISSQLVDYHIDKLVDNGQLIKVDSMYTAQKVFSNKKVYKFLKDTVITQELIEKLVLGTVLKNYSIFYYFLSKLRKLIVGTILVLINK